MSVLTASTREMIRRAIDERKREEVKSDYGPTCRSCGAEHGNWTLGCKQCSARHTRRLRAGTHPNPKWAEAQLNILAPPTRRRRNAGTTRIR